MSFIGRLEPLKKENRHLKIIVTGCAAERMGKALQRRFPIVDLTLGAKSIQSFPEVFDTAFPARSKKLPAPVADKSPLSALVTIMRGCDNFCSYCIVPHVRGREESRPAGEIIDEIVALAGEGTKEVMLLGQNVNSYQGTFKKHPLDFAGLLAGINEIPGIERIRFMTSHPKDLSDALIDAMSSLDKVCEHLHLPLQAGSDNVLKAMNRSYTAAAYKKLIEKLRRTVPGISITTDIMVGFPGETEQDFKKTMALVLTVRFDALFAFKYSPRPGTASANLPDDVDREAKEARLAALLDAANGISLSKNATLVGTVEEILVEEADGLNAMGRTRTNKKVFFTAPHDLTGQTVNVRISEAKPNSLTGTLLIK
jgi:tRNA-2-methylthio-N6-dimethylallyladenosine synthase